MPVPEPVRPAESVIHEALVEEVHAHPDCVVTVMVPVPPPGGAVTRSGVTENEQAALGSVTTKLRPPMVSVALRGELVVLAAALKPTVPGPLPLAPLVIVTHDAPLVAVQLQPVVVPTDTKLLPPFLDNDAEVGVNVYEHGAAACVTVKVLVPMVSVPMRLRLAAFA